MMWLSRELSLFKRRWKGRQDASRVLLRFAEARSQIAALPTPLPMPRRLLLIRLDDIGDYLLFRNQLERYAASPRWADHRITLLGNLAWRSLFEVFDAGTVHETIWVNKGHYLQDSDYRQSVWRQLRQGGYETVIAPSRTRPLLLDDACMLAAAPRHAIGGFNDQVHPAWRQVSDALYLERIDRASEWMHEFHCNAEFARRCCAIADGAERPTNPARPVIDERLIAHCPVIDDKAPVPLTTGEPYLVCFIGANTRSKRWPVRRWIEFIRLYARHHRQRILVAGQSKTEVRMAQAIERRTGAQSIAGRVSLPALARLIAGARAIVSNDTMAAHLGVSFNRSTVIIANGVNYYRFTDYEPAGVANVSTLYPKAFERRRAAQGHFAYAYEDAVSADLASITPSRVLAALRRLEQAAPPLSMTHH